MEKRGAINRYVPYHRTDRVRYQPVFTINLAHGTTPFLHFFEMPGQSKDRGMVECASDCYKLQITGKVEVTYGHYRPKREEFDKLEPSMQDHVLNGGLLIAKLEVAIINQLEPEKDIGDVDIGFHRFQAFCQFQYGKMKKPEPWMVPSEEG